MSNHLINETSPYLLQHANNPVDWYPWGEEAFEKAGKEDKPIFLSIGYSTCHWCHVMAHESFEDEQVAALLNQYFVSIKVDKEERPDVDSVYMSVCQALTGGGGWPTTIFMTPEQKPFFAGTYFPKTARYGSIGFQELLLTIADKWEKNRGEITSSADEITKAVTKHGESQTDYVWMKNSTKEDEGRTLIEFAVQIFERTFDREYGGFGDAPKFPSPHNLLFLMGYYERCRINKNSGAKEVLSMVEKTLHQMYRGGIFDHIGGGFCRYSTDRYFLAPHFEKMLYDNAMMILAYSKAYQLTGNVLYRGVAEKTAIYILKEMTSAEGGFYSAQDADSEGVEGRFYLFEPIEVMQVLGQKVGKEFCGYFDITGEGNFEGKNIPNLLQNRYISARYNELLPALYEYRKKRYYLHLDDKVLTSWNGLMIAAMCSLYRITDKKEYLMSAMQAQEFVTRNLSEETMASGGRLFVSWRNGLRKGKGLLDDYANEIFALLALYEATLQKSYLEKAKVYLRKTISDFWDGANGGFFLSGSENERLFMRPKETYDGAIPSGNSMMAYNLVRYHYLTGERCYMEILEKQLQFICSAASHYPAAYAMAMLAIQDFLEMPDKVVVVLGDGDIQSNAITLEGIVRKIPLDTIVRVLEAPTEEYPLKNNKTTYYVCKGKVCYPPKNELQL